MQHQASTNAQTDRTRTGRRPVLAAATTAGLLGLASLTAAPALAEQQNEQAQAPGTSQQPVVVVMDYSESMLEKDADENGTARIDAAKDATKDLIEKTPEDAKLGMVAFGHADRKTCTKIETLQKVAKVDAKKLTKKVDALDAQGGTPIGQSLQHAADELKDVEGEKSIVLVSDGEPTCDEPPACEIAQQLAEDGIDLTVHTIGFRLQGNTKAQETLECIAEATGGTYSSADDAEQLTETLTTQTTRALQGYQTAGTPVEGGRSAEDAPRMSAGQFTDTIATQKGNEDDGDDSAGRRYYRIPYHEGYTPVVTATVVKDRETHEMLGNSDVWIRPVDLSERPYETCSSLRDTVVPPHGSGMHATVHWFEHDSFSKELSEDTRDNCLTKDDEVVVEVVHAADTASDEEIPLELMVAYAKQEKASGSPAPSPKFKDVKTAKAEQVAGGGSFNDATPIESGQTITDTLVPGEAKYFKIDAATNQTLAARVDITSDAEDNLMIWALAYNPLREHMSFMSDPDAGGSGVNGTGDLSIIGPGEGSYANGVLEEHIHPNRRISSGGAEAYSVPGGQYIKVQREYDPSAADVPQSFELTVDVRGEAEEEAGEFITTSAEYTEAFGEDSDTGREEGADREDETEREEDTERDDADESDDTDREDDAESSDLSDEAEETDESEPSPSEAGGSEDGEEPSSGTDEQKDKDTEADVQAAESQDSGGIGGILPWAIGGLGVIALAGGGIILAGRRGA
ncbi:von Willebrand factor type A domain protein [Micrococcus lylae]|uniref:von Willebrand factor type A domain protein n=1 Tax=Micrococcus lylae TaxID=1273 RepID=A0A1R4JEU0_9MICC|nr:VWA domain-containing protein [Micrococcus lylae]SJN30547.1 von Willebrand factor type A domain protein [Micrococcus lylae]